MAVTWDVTGAVNTVGSNGNKTVAASPTGAHALGKATSGVSAGQKRYFEIQLLGAASDFSAGGGNGNLRPGGARSSFPQTATNGYLGGGDNFSVLANGAAIENNAVQSGTDSAYAYGNGDVIGIAVDYSSNSILFNKNGGSFKGPYTIPANDGTFYPAFEIGDGAASSSAQIVGRFSAADQAYAPPSGYSALDPGSNYPLTGTCAITLAPTGAITMNAALAGTTALSFANVGALGYTGALAGSSAIALAPAGSIGRSAALAGSTAITLSPAGALGYTGGLSGSTAITLAPAGAIGFTGGLTGTTQISFATDGGAIGGGKGPVTNPYLPRINQNDESFRKQLIAFYADINSRLSILEGVSSIEPSGVISDAYTVLTTAISTAMLDGVGLRDLYADQTGIDGTNSSGLVFSPGDVSNAQQGYTALPNMTGASAPTGYSATAYRPATGNTADMGSGYLAFDGSTSTSAGLTSTAPSASDPHAYQINAPASLKLTGYAPIFAAQNGYYPSDWTLEGATSANGPWTVLDTATSQAQAPSGYSKTFASPIIAYSCLRLKITSMAGQNVGSQVAEVGLKTASQAMTINAAVLRTISAPLQAAPSRGFLFALGKLASGGTLNTDLIGSVSRDGSALAQGTLKALATLPGGYPFLGLYGSDGKLGVDVSGQGAGSAIIGQLAMTNKARVDIAGLRTRGA